MSWLEGVKKAYQKVTRMSSTQFNCVVSHLWLWRQCGIALSLVVILASGLVTRVACHLLLKSAIMARRRNYEFLAFHSYGPTGKLIVELGVIGFLLGVSIAFFVVVGDLGPALAADFFMIENTPSLRAELLIILGLLVALPLGMLRKVQSLESLSAVSLVFYGLLILKSFLEAAPHLASGRWWNEVEWWRPQGFLPCLPIFSLALSCQT
ncbi:SLC38A10 [Cordylochernes scorpioides]|uniref:SLC38A10 n=1 Tax=Cordylochernes scorpioides TaxID=51811 RepID=A0ABY6L5B3_9ARAC|nr:SLC38A10 [Cordylochernes scorpioides]